MPGLPRPTHSPPSSLSASSLSASSPSAQLASSSISSAISAATALLMLLARFAAAARAAAPPTPRKARFETHQAQVGHVAPRADVQRGQNPLGRREQGPNQSPFLSRGPDAAHVAVCVGVCVRLDVVMLRSPRGSGSGLGTRKQILALPLLMPAILSASALSSSGVIGLVTTPFQLLRTWPAVYCGACGQGVCSWHALEM